MKDRHFELLKRQAQRAGVRVVFHDDPRCPFLAVVARREVCLYEGLSMPERFRLLCEAMQAFGLEQWLATPEPIPIPPSGEIWPQDLCDATRTVPNRPLAKPLVRGRDEKSTPTVSAEEPFLGRKFPATVASGACEICGESAYAVVLGLTYCRHHLRLSVQGQLRPEEVRRLRTRHGTHPEISFEQYDDNGCGRGALATG